MNIRRAQEKDITRILELLSQVLEVHANIRPDIFIPGTTKYSREDLKEIIADDQRPIYVAEDETGYVTGYAFCQLQEPKADTMIPRKILYIDDLCVDEKARGQHTGRALFEFVKTQAAELGCYEVTLNVWEGNEPALKFYRAMGMTPKETHMEFILK